MRSTRARRGIVSCILAASALSLGGCNALQLKSTWRDREITVDGASTEWENAVTYVEKNAVAIGVLNDEEYMYICLAAPERQIAAQVVSGGLTVWFDPEGGKDKTFGIRFPLGMQQRGLSGDTRQGTREGRQEPKKLQSLLEDIGDEMELLGPKAAPLARLDIPSAQGIGIEVKLGQFQGSLVYELKVPLARSGAHPYAIGAVAGKVIGLGFEAPKSERGEMRKGMGRRGGGMGGGPPGGGGFGGRPPGGRGGVASKMPEPLELRAKVKLASEVLPVQK